MKKSFKQLMLCTFALLLGGANVQAATETYDFTGISSGASDQKTPTYLEGDYATNIKKLGNQTAADASVRNFGRRFALTDASINGWKFRDADANNKGLWAQYQNKSDLYILNLATGDKVTIVYGNENIMQIYGGSDIVNNTAYTATADGDLHLVAKAGGVYIHSIVIETTLAVETITVGGTTESYNFGAIAKDTKFTTDGASGTTIALAIADNDFNGRFSLGTDSRDIAFKGAGYGLQMIYQNRGLFINNLKVGDQVKLTFTTEGSQVLKFKNGGNVGEEAEATVESGKWYTVTTAGQLQTTNSTNGSSDKTNITEVQIKTYVESLTAGTLVSTKALDFTGSSVSAYYASSASAGTVTFTPINKVAAGTPVYIKADAAGYYDIPVLTDDAEDITGNLLKGFASSETSLQSTEETKYYVFGVKDSGAGFYPVSTSSALTSAAGKAYLQLTAEQAGAAAARLTLNFEDSEATAIESTKAAVVEDNAWYTLQGVRVATPTKGIYVKNGKKVYVK